jgi:hypothetical protein
MTRSCLFLSILNRIMPCENCEKFTLGVSTQSVLLVACNSSDMTVFCLWWSSHSACGMLGTCMTVCIPAFYKSSSLVLCCVALHCLVLSYVILSSVFLFCRELCCVVSCHIVLHSFYCCLVIVSSSLCLVLSCCPSICVVFIVILRCVVVLCRVILCCIFSIVVLWLF